MSAFQMARSQGNNMMVSNNLDYRHYEKYFIDGEVSLFIGKQKIERLFIPISSNERYREEDFRLFLQADSMTTINTREIHILSAYKLVILQLPEIAIPKIFYFLRPILALQLGVKYIISQLFGIKENNQIKLFLEKNPYFIQNFQRYFDLLCQFYRNSKFCKYNSIINEEFETEVYMSFIQYLDSSIKEDKYIPNYLQELWDLDLTCIEEGYVQPISNPTNSDIFLYFQTKCPTPNLEASKLNFCPLCDSFVQENLYTHWSLNQNSLNYCEATCRTLDKGFKCAHCNFYTKNRTDIFLHFNTFCSKNFNYCHHCDLETSKCACGRLRVDLLHNLQSIYEKYSENQQSVLHPDNFSVISKTLEINKNDLMSSLLNKDLSDPGQLSVNVYATEIPLLVTKTIEERIDDFSRNISPGSKAAPDGRGTSGTGDQMPGINGERITNLPAHPTPPSQLSSNPKMEKTLPRGQQQQKPLLQHTCFCGVTLNSVSMETITSHLSEHSLPFTCSRCYYRGHTLGDLVSHIRTHVHEEVDKVPCTNIVAKECRTAGKTSAAESLTHDLIHHTDTRKAYQDWLGELAFVQIELQDNSQHGSTFQTAGATSKKNDNRSHKSQEQKVNTMSPFRNKGKVDMNRSSYQQGNVRDLEDWSMSDDQGDLWNEPIGGGDKKFPCESAKCKARGIVFDQQEHLETHIQEKHACTECNFASMYDSELLAHILSHKTPGKEHQCGYCNATFTSKAALNKHFQGQHSLECNICKERNFNTQEALALHRETCDHATVGEISKKDSDPVIQLANILLLSNPAQKDKISSLIATQIRNNERLLNPKKFLTKRGLYLELPSFSPTPGRAVPSHRLKNLPEFAPTLGRDKDALRNHLQLTKVMSSLRALVAEFSLDENTAVSIFLQTCSEEVINTLNALSVVEVTAMSLEAILHTLRDVFYSIDIEEVYLKSSNIQRLSHEDLRSYYIRMMNIIKLASYYLPPPQRMDWIDANSRSNFLKHAPSDFVSTSKEEEIKRGQRYTGPEIFSNYLEYVKATKKKNELGIHNLKEGSNRHPKQTRPRDRLQDPPKTSEQTTRGTNHLRRGGPNRGNRGRGRSNRGHFRGNNRGTGESYPRRGGSTTSPGDHHPYTSSHDNRNTQRTARPNNIRGATRGGFNGPSPKLFLDAIRKSLNLGPNDLACYLCGKRNDHISRNCDIYQGVQVQDKKCQECLRFFHPTNLCKSRFRGINNKEE